MAVDNKGDVRETPRMEARTNENKQTVQLPRIVTTRVESPNLVLARRILSCKLSDRVYGGVSSLEPIRQRLRKDVDDLVRSPTSLLLGTRSPQRLGESTNDIRGQVERYRSNVHLHWTKVEHKHDKHDREKHDRDVRKGDDSGLGSSIGQKRVQCNFMYKTPKFYERRKFAPPLPRDSVTSDNSKPHKSMTKSKHEESNDKETTAQPQNGEVPGNSDNFNRRENTKEVLNNLCDHPAVTRRILRELDEKGRPPRERTHEWLMKYTV